jgi:hypothetical protein
MEVEEELKALRARVRNLERSLAESEALSLQQIECTHRLEQQLLEAQAPTAGAGASFAGLSRGEGAAGTTSYPGSFSAPTAAH